jgi:DNA-binding NarL/FixJ family response regulator
VPERAGGKEVKAIVAGTRLLQQALTALLERTGAATVVGTCGAAEAAAMARERSPDVVVIEIGAGGSAIDTHLRGLMHLRPAQRTIAICRGASPDEVAAAVGLGVDAVVSENSGSQGLLEAFEAVRHGHRYFGSMVSELSRATTSTPDAKNRVSTAVRLTRREQDVLELIAQAMTGREIATQLGMSARTVHAHWRSIMNKLQVRRVVALVRRAIRLGLVDP